MVGNNEGVYQTLLNRSKHPVIRSARQPGF